MCILAGSTLWRFDGGCGCAARYLGRHQMRSADASHMHQDEWMHCGSKHMFDENRGTCGCLQFRNAGIIPFISPELARLLARPPAMISHIEIHHLQTSEGLTSTDLMTAGRDHAADVTLYGPMSVVSSAP
jgi:hypothetical protein